MPAPRRKSAAVHLDAADALERAGARRRGRRASGRWPGVFCRSRARLAASATTAAALDRARHVVVRGDDAAPRPRRSSVAAALVAVEPVGGEQRALDERARHGVVDVVGQLPAERRGPELARARRWRPRRRRSARARRRTRRACRGRRAASGARPACATARWRKAGARLARVEQALERAVLDVVRDGLAVEHPDDERVCAGVGGEEVVADTRMRPASVRDCSIAARTVPSPDVKDNRSPCPRPSSSVPPAPRSASSAAASPPLDATELGGLAIKAALERADVGPEQVQHVVVGQVIQAGQGQIPSRQAQIKAGIPKEVSSETINKVCASGIRAAGIIDAAIRAGDLDVGVAGGMESMSNAPYLLKEARFGFRMGDAKAIDAMINDGLRNPFSGKQMFEEAGEVADELEMTRADLDRWALRSHELAIKATDEGRLSGGDRPGDRQGPQGRHGRRGRRGAAPRHVARVARQAASRSRATRARTRPATRRASTTAAARSCSPRPSGPRANGKTVLAEILAQAAVADDFPYLARTPAAAAKKALEKAGLTRRRRRPLGDQRGVRVGRGQLGPRPRHRRGQGQRQRRRGRARPPDRRVRRADPRRARARAAPARRRHRRAPRSAAAAARATPSSSASTAPEHRGEASAALLVTSDGSDGGAASTEAAFFDLDRTLMAGSSGFHWAREARRAGLISRRRLAARRVGQPALPPRGLDRRGAPTRCASASGR